MSEQQPQTEIPIPDLNRQGVTKRTQGVPFFDRDAYGTYTLALRHFRFEKGQKNNPHFRADCVILASDNEAWFSGRDVSIYFHTGRPGTATDPGRPDRDDAYVASFVRAVLKVPSGKPYDNVAAMKALLAKGKIADDTVTFRFIRQPGNISKVFDKKTETIVEVQFEKDTFAATPRAA